jgi:hypothetical protein
MPRFSRRRFAAVGIPLVLLAWLGFRAFQAGTHLSHARAELASARQDLLDRKLDAADAAVRRAGRDTATARSATRDPLWWVLAHVPLLGRSPSAVSGMAAAADDLTRRVLPSALDEARRLDPKKVRRSDGTVDLAALHHAEPPLEAAAAGAARDRRRVEATPSSLLVPPVGHARAQLVEQVQKLDEVLRAASRAVRMAPALLGEDRTRRYFVAVQQTSESRGTGGIIGGYAVLEASKGKLRLVRQGSDQELIADLGSVPPPPGLPSGYVETYSGSDAFVYWQSINLSPDLPSVARVVTAKWARLTGQHVDGVIALDGVALQDLLSGSGPLDVGAGRTIQPDELADYLAVGQYEGLSLDPAQISGRKDRLQEIAGDVLKRLTTSGSGSEDLLRGLTRALQSGHLRMASADPALAGLHEAGVDGALPSGPGPVAYPVLYNAMGSKLDRWIARKVIWSCPSHGHVTVTVELRNDVPDGALPPYVTLDLRANPVVRQSRTDSVHLDVWVTRGAKLVAMTRDGTKVQPSSNGMVDGLPFWGTDLDLAPGRTYKVALELDGAGSSRSVRIEEQPLARPLDREVERGC